ncbi:DUF6377 domain-containing protein [Bacteroides sp. 51]|uniref:DUF6377 domain-containing protein n=1 Tax=Bacteroides sp. 51 TaxID=2302938 RepID=UPI0013D26ACD|nr:DUF6377 domain-containing protein [Bacteroides sp. 51]NDV80944.1 hypothetical protein [Bacteroides sp. 51]
MLIFCIFSTTIYGKNDLKQLSNFLDHIINNKEQYTEKKEQEINSLKKLLKKKGSSPEYIYEINYKLCDEYEKYKIDTAVYYALENVRIAQQLDNQRLKFMSDIRLASVYSYSGKFLESRDILKNIPSHQLPQDLLPVYYETYSRFFYHYAVISNQGGYNREAGIYQDSLLSVLEPSTFKYKINLANKYANMRKNKEAEEILNDLFRTETADSPEYAMITHNLAVINGRKEEWELEKKYYIMSAIADIKSSIKENASCLRLALIYYNSGDINKAFRYTQSAIEDAVFSGAQFRTAEMAEFYSIINASYQLKETKTNSKLKTNLIWISILSIFLILLVIYIYKQMKKLSRVKEKLSQTNIKLNNLITELNERNNQINERNEQLHESNQIKEQYIAQFFNLCSTYIDKIEEFRKGLYKLAINRQYEDLIKRLKSTATVDNDLEELYANFDNIFLNLYPTFVSDFNSLLEQEEQIHLKTDDLLNKELRIYALLRLGITDSTQIAGFLRCSMSTIYNYRTKMRNKAAFNREKFEEMVMKIGIMKKTVE